MSQEQLYKILRGPVVSEKAYMNADVNNQIAFKVDVGASKQQIKSAVEKLFSVDVLSVRVLNVKGKQKRTRYGMGKKNDWKKAYVRLAEGQDIDFAVAS